MGGGFLRTFFRTDGALDVESKQLGEAVQDVERQPAGPAHEPGQEGLRHADLLGDRVAADAGTIDRLPDLVAELEGLLGHVVSVLDTLP